MVLSSIPFLFFFTVIFVLYWFVVNKNLKKQNLLILLSSYIFYAFSDWRFLIYLIAATILNFYLGIYIARTTNLKIKKLLVNIALLQGVGGLVFFKYFNFFITSFNDAFNLIGLHFSLHTLNLLIPLGISFFTFKLIGYILDINKGKIQPSTDWIVFFSFVSFFPTILAGPIDSARKFIPQLERRREFNITQAANGMRQILWGLFKKVVIADTCYTYSSTIFENYHTFPASSLFIGAFLYTIELYADFSGYSDMAIGIARLLGFKVTKNFEFPFFAQNIADFWRKWHISLTSWLTEYVFTPLSITFRDYGKTGLILAIVLNFTICGIWHGANWTYVLYGFLHGCYFIPLIINGTMNKKKKKSSRKLLPTIKESLNMLGTFSLVMFTLMVFRADNIKQAFSYFRKLFSLSLFQIPKLGRLVSSVHFSITIFFIVTMLIIEWFQKEKEFGLQIEFINDHKVRWGIYYFFIISILLFEAKQKAFIYTKF